ncbi:patatin-like phospholipase domain-containing protein 7 [Sinocyclocheilus rhinocerous]|nr:PREDICTED: patatin-like phospholipase domain-containing protein 7 [Sinocyclocheilus rhinocerous]
MMKDRHQEEFHKTQSNNLVTCPNASFTDLAEIVSRIEPVKPALVDDESDYHTDNEEEMAESALSDIELYSHYSEHTVEELTADTVGLTYTCRLKGTSCQPCLAPKQF